LERKRKPEEVEAALRELGTAASVMARRARRSS
jgi:hypothetical protein